jgi:hypothetical protein
MQVENEKYPLFTPGTRLGDADPAHGNNAITMGFGLGSVLPVGGGTLETVQGFVENRALDRAFQITQFPNTNESE